MHFEEGRQTVIRQGAHEAGPGLIRMLRPDRGLHEEYFHELVAAIRAVAPALRRHSFVASIRELDPELDPWSDPSRHQPGAVFPCVVVRSGDDFVLVLLETHALAIVLPGDWRDSPPLEGTRALSQLVDVDVENQKLRAVLL